MSTSCTMAGFSVPFKDEYQENDFLIKYFKVSNEDELQDLIYSSDKTNQWELADDYENKGLVFRTHNDRDEFYLKFQTSESKIKEVKELIPDEYKHMVEMGRFKVFALLYHNGSESPFQF